MPVFLGMPAFAPLTMPWMQMVAVGSLIGHLVYGLILWRIRLACTTTFVVDRRSTRDHTHATRVNSRRLSDTVIANRCSRLRAVPAIRTIADLLDTSR